MNKILECSSKGDKRFSALYAKINLFGKYDSIENHYQMSKRFIGQELPLDFKSRKGKKPDYFEISGKEIRLELSEKFYTSM